jgi:hypothetical protein
MPHGPNYNKSKNARDKSKDKILLLYKEGWRGGRVWPSPFPSFPKVFVGNLSLLIPLLCKELGSEEEPSHSGRKVQFRKTDLKQVLWKRGSGQERPKSLIVLVGRTGIEPVAR